MIKTSFKRAALASLGAAVALGIGIKLALAVDPFTPANQPVGYVGQVELTSLNLRSGKEVLFRGQYEREFWSGTVFANSVDSAGNLKEDTSWWSGGDAAALIDKQDFDSGRLIATMKDGTGVPFRFSSLSTRQQGYLESSNVLDFLRGDRSNEKTNSGKTFRARVSVLGDIVHSRPYYVADDTSPTLFVGANDGMLHAINAGAGVQGGTERWAYVPSMLLFKMKNLAADPYVHDYFVDGQVNIGRIQAGSKRVLVGALGAGGKGLYALDITSLGATTESEVASKVMWEISPTKLNDASPSATNAYVNLGYTYGAVTLAKVKVNGSPVDAVIVGNGYNDGTRSGTAGYNDYSGCSPTTTGAASNYANCGGNFAAYLYVINAQTGQLISAIKAGTNGTEAAPNGLSSPVAVDEDGDGAVDLVFAGDLNGTMWQFDLVTNESSVLLVTSPAQAITSMPGVGIHPEGGYMVTFGTGKMLTAADATDNSVHYVYGVWKGAPSLNTAMVEQKLDERTYKDANGVELRVRRIKDSVQQPVWTSGAGNHRGWKVALPAGERIVGEGSFTENGRFYFTGFNPTKSVTISNSTSPPSTTTIPGENWLMELDYLTGGAKNQPFLDLSGNIELNDEDRLKYITGDTVPTTTPATKVGDPIKTVDGVPVGKFIANGLLSQPILVQLSTLNDTLFNQNPDVIVPVPNVDRGVEGGHFDADIYYGTPTAAVAATATITVGTNGQTSPYPATLGAIAVNGVQIASAFSTSEFPDGTASNANAEAIRSKIGNGFTATRNGNVVTVTAPMGLSYNGLSLSIGAGTSQQLVAGTTEPAVKPSTNGRLVISDVTRNREAFIRCGTAYTTGGPGTINVSSTRNQSDRLNDFFDKIHNKTVNGYKTTCTKSLSSGLTVGMTCTIEAPPGASACSSGFALQNIDTTANTGPQGGSDARVTRAPSGHTNLLPALATTTFSGAAASEAKGDTCEDGRSICQFKRHVHEYDDLYDRTGVNFLDASDPLFDLSNAIPSPTMPFKVIAQNQYLSPAVRLHIGQSNYQYSVDSGYIWIRNFQTSPDELNLASLPTYTRQTIGSLVLNLPPDAFNGKNWWNGINGLPPDVRDGLHPTEYACATYSASATRDGNMYRPVIPPDTVTETGNGTRGYSLAGVTPATTQLTAKGVRHNGALVVQIIRADTPQSAIERSIEGRPEYGWRVKAADYSKYVLAELSMFHHTIHLGLCYGDDGWSKNPSKDTRVCGTKETTTTRKCAEDRSELANLNGTDPKIGNLGGGNSVSSVDVTVSGDTTTTTITYVTGLKAQIIRTINDNGSVTITTIPDMSDPTTSSTTVTASKLGSTRKGTAESSPQARTGRISWRELVMP